MGNLRSDCWIECGKCPVQQDGQRGVSGFEVSVGQDSLNWLAEVVKVLMGGRI